MAILIRRGVGISAAVAPGGITQPTGLRIYYTFDNANTSSATATDTNPNGFGPTNLTLNNSPVSAPGQIGQGRLFENGAGRYGTTSAFQAPQTALSVSIWVNPAVINATECIAAQQDGSTSAWVFLQNSDGTLISRIATDGSNWIARTSAAALTTGSYQHVVSTWSGGATAAAIKIYLNGSQVDTGDANIGTFAAINTASIAMGVGANGVGGFGLDSSVDDFRLYNRELSGADVTAIYNAGLAGNP